MKGLNHEKLYADTKITLPKEVINWRKGMGSEIRETESNKIYSAISLLIDRSKRSIQRTINDSMILLYWNIGKYLVCNVLEGNKAEYGQKIVEDVAQKLTANYGKGFAKSSLFRMIKFYDEFPDYEKVATLSQQLTWSHFVSLLPIEDETKREFYAIMCHNENWSVRTLRERRKSMLFERTAISQKPDLTIKNDLELLHKESKMSTDLFYRDPYTYSVCRKNTANNRAFRTRQRQYPSWSVPYKNASKRRSGTKTITGNKKCKRTVRNGGK